ncbi:nucleotidyltransferase family protein [Alteromonas sp. a30]|uniref:nucleotidyltransferase family protein n=1 Tax=Alteromonas sp. a30 TaxID=2730917 RepID=UPI0022818507|nr:nucleotidyltransferase family protein [Alteromonas sp. a30]MCY7296201.1 nucleotidyltransferase family protein [Alteromonas sp. a30]
MKALLLAGGFGTRLKPLTDHTPKCLVPIAGKPLLGYWLEQLAEHDCHKIIVNTHYLHKQVENYIEASPYRHLVELVYEPVLLGTLGSIRAYRDFFDEDATLIAHADNFCLTDWQGFKQAFTQRPASARLTMMLFKTPTPWSCGIVKTDANGLLSDYIEKPQAAKEEPERFGYLANAAVVITSQAGLDDMCALQDQYDDLCRDYLPLQIGRANTYLNQGIHIDIGTPQTYALANRLMQKSDS